jgi:inositol transport system ATP-binding protein
MIYDLTPCFPRRRFPCDVALSVKPISEGVFRCLLRSSKGRLASRPGRRSRTNVAETIFGVTPATSGEIFVNGKKLIVDSPQTAMRAGMALLTEDRKDTGCFLVLSVLENMEMAVLQDRFFKNGFVTQRP